MSFPARYIAGNLVFTRDGQTWAFYRVEPPTYGRLPEKDKLGWHTLVSAALASLPGESMILGVARPLEPSVVVAAMVDGVDLGRHPRWAEIARDTLDALTAARLTTRVHYLGICLPAPKGAKRLGAVLGAAMSNVSVHFGVPALPVSTTAVRTAQGVAGDIATPLNDMFGGRLEAATEAELEWLYARAALRGLDEPLLGEFQGPSRTTLAAAHLAALAQPVLVEGGDERDGLPSSRRRLVRIDTERGSSYQTVAVFSHVPARFEYPRGRGEVLARLGESDVPVDWCLRIKPTSNAAAQLEITGKIRKLSGQFQEYDGDLAGAPDTLADSIGEMRAELARLNGSPSMPECQVTFMLALSADSPALLEERMERVRALLEANEFVLPRPIGDQAALWEAMLPGATAPSVVAEFGQFMLTDYIAGQAPFTGSELGDPTGPLLGLNLDASSRPVHFWAGTGPNMPEPYGPKSGSIGIFGRLGGGKSFLGKRIITDTVETGGRVILTDRTPMGEYCRLAAALGVDGHTSQIIELGPETKVCLDPLRVFRGEEAIRYGSGFLGLLTGIDPTSPEGAVVQEAVRAVVERGGRLRDVVTELDNFGDKDTAFAMAAQTMALKLKVFTRGALADIAFGEGDPVSLKADYSVFWAPNLSLPSPQALKDRRQLMPEQVFNQALLYLITAVARYVAFSERDRFSLVVQDEGYVMTASAQGQELLDVILRDGRKHNAALLFISHHPDDLDPILQQLLGSRFLFRMDRAAAPSGLHFMGMETTEENLDTIEEAQRQTGECLFRDLDGRLGLLKILPPRTAELRAAFDTGLSRVRSEAGGSTAPRRRRRETAGV